MADALLTTFVSQLAEETKLSSGDLLLVSKLSSTAATNSGYVSRKVTYGTLSSSLVSDVDSKISSGIEDATAFLSSAISANTDAISALSAREMACESAVIKIANCVQQAKNDIITLSSQIASDAASCLWRDQQLCAALNATSSYLSSASKYISSQVSADYKTLSTQIQYLSSQHNWLSTQLSTEIRKLSTSLSTTVSSYVKTLSTQISVLCGDIADLNDNDEELQRQIDDVRDSIPDYSDDINQLKYDMYEAGGNVEVLCSRVNAIETRGSVKYFGVFASLDAANGQKSNMKPGDYFSVGKKEYYLSGTATNNTFAEMGNEDLNALATSATYWNQAYTEVNSHASQWTQTYNDVSNGKSNWNSTYSTVNSTSASWNAKEDAQVVTKSQIASITPAANTIYFCTDA